MSTRLSSTDHPRDGRVTLRQLRKLWIRLQYAAERSVDHSKPNMMAVGLVGVVGFPLYYFIWSALFPQAYESLSLRLLGAVVAVPMLLIDHWPRPLRRYIAGYWFCALCYSMPFFFTFMLLKNDASMVWAMSTMAAAVLLVLLINDWVMLLAAIVVGCGLAWIGFDLSGGQLGSHWNAYLVQIPIYLFVLVAGSVFNYKTELLKQEKLQAVAATSSNIAHELRTPLLSIRSGVGGLNRYLPQLLQAYELAQAHELPVEPIRTAHYRQLASVLERIEAETRYSNLVIDLLLSNAQDSHIDREDFTQVWMSASISEALSRYPFKSAQEHSRVRWSGEHDFAFHGSAILMVHILFNLLKNSLHATTGKGRISIWMTQAERGYTLHFRDTGQGIEADKLPFIFDRFYSAATEGHGAGIGLAFCRMVMKSFGGRIDCLSSHGHFTEFLLHFPRAKGYGDE